jgi:hypothetical protein
LFWTSDLLWLDGDEVAFHIEECRKGVHVLVVSVPDMSWILAGFLFVGVSVILQCLPKIDGKSSTWLLECA